MLACETVAQAHDPSITTTILPRSAGPVVVGLHISKGIAFCFCGKRINSRSAQLRDSWKRPISYIGYLMIRKAIIYMNSVMAIILSQIPPYPKMAFKSSSAVVIGLISKFFTSVSSTLGVRNAGSEGPRRMPLIPR